MSISKIGFVQLSALFQQEGNVARHILLRQYSKQQLFLYVASQPENILGEIIKF